MIKKIVAAVLLAGACALLIFILLRGTLFPHLVGPAVLIAVALFLLLHQGRKQK